MRHSLTDVHKSHFRRLGMLPPDAVEISEEQYNEHLAAWKRTLPQATEEELHTKVLAHATWNPPRVVLPEEKTIIPMLGAKIGQAFYDGRWELRVIIVLLAGILCLLLAHPAKAQFSRINSIEWDNQGSQIAFFTFPHKINCSTNMTCTITGTTITLTASSTASTAWAANTAGANSNAGTFSVSGNSWDFTGSTIFKLRVGAGCTTSANGDMCFDSTAAIWRIWQGGASRNNIAATNVGTAGQPCLSNADGSCTFADPLVQGNVASGATDAGNPVKTGAIFNSTQPTVTNGQRVDSQATARGAHIVATGVDAFHITCDSGCGAATVGQGSPNTLANAWPVKVTDGTNAAAVKAASTAAAAADPSAVVALSPNSPLPAGGNVIGALSANQSINVNQYGGVLTTLGQKSSVSSIPIVPANDYLPSDTIGTTVALNGANATATVVVTGQQGAGSYIISGGSLIATIVPEVSYNGASGPWLASFFYNPTTGALSNSLSVNSPTDIYLTVLTPSGTSNARIRVSSYTSGSSNAVMRATFAVVDPLPLLGSNPVGTEFGIVVRNIPSGTQTVAGTLNATQSGTWTVQPGNTANTTPWLTTINQGGNSASVNASGQLVVNCAAGCSASAPADVVATGTLGAAGNAVTLTMAGVNSASFSLPASNNLVAVLTPEALGADGAVIAGTLIRQQGPSSFWTSTVSVNSTNASWNVLVPGGAVSVRVRVSTYTSGSTTGSMRGTQQPEAFGANVGAAGSAAPQGITQIGGSDGTNLRALNTDATGKPNVLIQANASINEAQVAGTAKSVNNGTTDAGTTRVTISSDSTGQVKETNFPATVDTNNGATSASTPRVTISNDSTGQIIPAPTTASADAVSACNILSAASTNSTSCKGSAGNFYGYEIFNTTTTIYYLRLYNTSAAPTCSSATGFIRSIPIPPAGASGQADGTVSNQMFPVNYGTGIGYCITGGSSSTDNTNAAVGIFGEIRFK